MLYNQRIRKQSTSRSLEANQPPLSRIPSVEYFKPLGHRLSAGGFHFQNDDIQANVSTWVRVIQRMADKGRGMHITPRIGHEVLVSFLLGDPDAPVVTGSLYNGQGEGDDSNSPAAQSINNSTTENTKSTNNSQDSLFAQASNHIAAASGDANHRHAESSSASEAKPSTIKANARLSSMTHKPLGFTNPQVT